MSCGSGPTTYQPESRRTAAASRLTSTIRCTYPASAGSPTRQRTTGRSPSGFRWPSSRGNDEPRTERRQIGKDGNRQRLGMGFLGTGSFGALPPLYEQNGIAAGEQRQIAVQPDAIGQFPLVETGHGVRADADAAHAPDFQRSLFGAADVLLDLP